LSGYEKQLKSQRAKEHVSGHALVNLVPNLHMLEPVFKACETNEDARRTLIAGFTGDEPIYHMLKHPKALAAAAKKIVRDKVG
jgi:hypothetical protein